MLPSDLLLIGMTEMQKRIQVISFSTDGAILTHRFKMAKFWEPSRGVDLSIREAAKSLALAVILDARGEEFLSTGTVVGVECLFSDLITSPLWTPECNEMFSKRKYIAAGGIVLAVTEEETKSHEGKLLTLRSFLIAYAFRSHL